MRKIELTPGQTARVTALAKEKWTNADVRSTHDVFDVLDLAKYVLGGEVPEITQMKIDALELHSEDFRLHVQVDRDLLLATRMLCVDDFNQNNGKPTNVAVEYILRTLLYFRNALVTQAKEAF